MRQAAAIDDGGWTGARSAPVAGDARLEATPRRERELPAAPARGGSGFAALVSLAVHAAIIVAAALSLGAPQPTGEPNAIAVELVAASGEAPAAAAAPNAESTRAGPNLRNDAPPPPPTRADAPAPVPTDAPQPAAPKPSETSEAAIPAAAKSVDAAEASDAAPPAPLMRDPASEATPAVVAPAPVSPPSQSASAPPEADFAAAPAVRRAEPKAAAKPPAARAVARLEPPARPSGAGARTSAAASALGAAELAAYRNALLAKIWGSVRYPEPARERGAIGVATVRFALDGGGAVTLADLAQSSGDRALDDEALAAVRRASPLPAPPTGAPRAYSAPIRFELR